MEVYQRAVNTYNSYTADPKRKNYFDIAATLALLIVLILMIYPAVNHILKLNKEISDGRLVETSLEDKIDDLNVAKENFDEVQDDLPLLETALPTGSDIKNYLQKPIEQLADNHKLTIKAVLFSEVPVSDPDKSVELKVRQIDYSVTFLGNFVDFSNFVTDLEKFIRVTDVDRIDIKKPDLTSPTNYTVNATTRYLGLPVITIPSRSRGSTQ
jgi:Tfp pilus assembly protein PilO